MKISRLSVITVVVALFVCLFRINGYFFNLELLHFDWLWQHRLLQSPQYSPIVLVEQTEADIQALHQSILSDRTLAELLEKILQSSPRVIGLDLVRDQPETTYGTPLEQQRADYQALIEIFDNNRQIYGVFRSPAEDAPQQAIAPPPKLFPGRVGDITFPADQDGVIRRAFFYINSVEGISLKLAQAYLEDVETNFIGERAIQIQSSNLPIYTFPFFQGNDGGYVGEDDGGLGFLIHWKPQPQTFDRISVTQVLAEDFDPEQLGDRLVLIGSTAPSLPDSYPTPFGILHGVEIIANATNQLIDPQTYGVIHTSSDTVEYLSIFLTAAFTMWVYTRHQHTTNPAVGRLFILAALIPAPTLLIFSYIAFAWDWWLAVVPAAIACVVVWLVLVIYSFASYIRQLDRLNRELKALNANLEQQVETRTQQLLVQQTLAKIGALSAGIAHNLKNPLYSIDHFHSALRNRLQRYCRQTIEKATEIGQIEFVNDAQQLQEAVNLYLDKCDEKSFAVNKLLLLICPSTDKLIRVEVNEQINQIIRDAYAIAFKSSNVDDIYYELNLDPRLDSFKLKTVPVGLISLFAEFITNAVKAIERKRSQQDCSYNPEIKIISKLIETSTPPEIEIKFVDNGSGIDLEEQNLVFTPFYSKDPSNSNGIGLWLAYNTITQIGGSIKIDSQVNEYTCFTINFPIKN